MKIPAAVALSVILIVIAAGTPFAQPTSSGWSYGGTGLTYSSSLDVAPSDSDGALGRSYLVVKANYGISFTPRASLSPGGGNTAGPQISDYTFWATAINGTGNPTTYTIPTSSLLHPGSLTSLPSGTASFVPSGDGHIVYDPNDSCGDGQGRWLLVEMANLTIAGSTSEGILIGVTTTEVPDPANGAVWHVFGILSPIPITSIPSNGRAADFPQTGFNTSWITVTANSFFPDGSGGYSGNSAPIQFVFNHSAECGALPPASVNVMPAGKGAVCTGVEGTGAGPAWYCNDTTAQLACPAETYYTYGQNPDGATEYLINSDPGNDAVRLFQIDNANNNGIPTYEGQKSDSTICPNGSCLGDGSPWSNVMPQLGQDGSNTQIKPGLDDRITSCAVRNYGMWAVQTVGLPAGGAQTAVAQFWNIGVDSVLGQLYSFQRIGGTVSPYIYNTPSGTTPMNVMVPSIGVDYYSNLVMGFEILPETGQNVAYLQQGYALKWYSSVSFYAPYHAADGFSDYFPSPNPNVVRSGDFTASGVDPNDDYSLWTVGDYAANNAWAINWEIMAPQDPVTPTFSGYASNEWQCNPYYPGTPCYDTVDVPSTVQPGDTAYAVVATGTALGSQYSPGWYPLTEADGNTYESVSGTDQYGCPVTQYYQVYAHKVVQGDSAYTFQVPSELSCSGAEINNIGVALVGYHNAQRVLFSPNGFQQLLLYGGSTVDVAIQTPQTSFPGYNTLANLFYGSANFSADQCEYFSLQGSPALTTETPVTQCYSTDGYGLAPLLDGDLWTGGGGSFGPYDMYDGINGPKAAYSLSIYPY